MNSFEEHIRQYISSLSLLCKDDLYLVALSGGADSVCLLRCLSSLGYRIEAAHCNFHLRGEEADRDEAFCQELCRQLHVPFHVTHFETSAYATRHRVSIEMAARELRYAYFRSLCRDIGAAGVCVGHHQDDSVETILMNMVRSTGIHGLTGISPANGQIYRPLLCVTHSEIIDYLDSVKQEYVTDSTNLVADVQRNKMRLEVIPLLEQMNPSARQNILKTAARLADAACLLDSLMGKLAQWRHEGEYLIFPLKAVTHEYLLWYLLKDLQFTPAQTEQIYGSLHKDSGRIWASATHEVLIDRDRLVLCRLSSAQPHALTIPGPGDYAYGESLGVRLSLLSGPISPQSLRNRQLAFIDSSKVGYPLTLRTVREGDRFQPFGMKGTKLLSDYMTDRKMSLFEKRRQLVLADADDHILWVVSQRLADPYKVTTSTGTVLKVELLSTKPSSERSGDGKINN